MTIKLAYATQCMQIQALYSHMQILTCRMLAGAQCSVRMLASHKVNVHFAKIIYFLPETLVIYPINYWEVIHRVCDSLYYCYGL
jgi:hypothetical protein